MPTLSNGSIPAMRRHNIATTSPKIRQKGPLAAVGPGEHRSQSGRASALRGAGFAAGGRLRSFAQTRRVAGPRNKRLDYLLRLRHSLAEADVDAVYIATPHHLHVDMCLKALAANKHILCEKPLGIIAPMSACSTRSRKATASPAAPITVSSPIQFKTTYRMIQDGTIGDLVGGWAHDEENYYNPSNAPLRKELACHDPGLRLLPAQSVAGALRHALRSLRLHERLQLRPPADYDIDDLENIILRYPMARSFRSFSTWTA